MQLTKTLSNDGIFYQKKCARLSPEVPPHKRSSGRLTSVQSSAFGSPGGQTNSQIDNVISQFIFGGGYRSTKRNEVK